jgi:predicted transcriptional regulator
MCRDTKVLSRFVWDKVRQQKNIYVETQTTIVPTNKEVETMSVDKKLDSILQRLGSIEDRISALEENAPKRSKKRLTTVPLGEKVGFNPWVLATMSDTGVDSNGNVSLDVLDTLKPTIEVLLNQHKEKIDSLNAEQVAKKTNKAINTQSGYLNRLTRMGLVQKRKHGKEAYFRVTDTGIAHIQKIYPDMVQQ